MSNGLKVAFGILTLVLLLIVIASSGDDDNV